MTLPCSRAIVLVVAAGALACSTSPSAQSGAASGATVVAQVGDRQFTLEEVDKRALMVSADRYAGQKLMHALYQARRDALEILISDHLLETEAKTRRLAAAELVERDITSKIAAVADAEVDAWFRENPDRVRGATLDQVRVPIRQLLERERSEAAFKAYLDALKARTTVRVTLDPPRQDVRVAANDPTRGNARAPVEIIEFSDFQ